MKEVQIVMNIKYYVSESENVEKLLSHIKSGELQRDMEKDDKIKVKATINYIK